MWAVQLAKRPRPAAPRLVRFAATRAWQLLCPAALG